MNRSKNVESLRCLMIETVEQRGSLTHPDVIAISRQLDALINEIQRERFKKYHRRVLIRPCWSSFRRRYTFREARLFRPLFEIQS